MQTNVIPERPWVERAERHPGRLLVTLPEGVKTDMKSEPDAKRVPIRKRLCAT
jgi:hypothetical protein